MHARINGTYKEAEQSARTPLPSLLQQPEACDNPGTLIESQGLENRFTWMPKDMQHCVKFKIVLNTRCSAQMLLFGQEPETIMGTALAAIDFYVSQQGLVAACRYVL